MLEMSLGNSERGGILYYDMWNEGRKCEKCGVKENLCVVFLDLRCVRCSAEQIFRADNDDDNVLT